MKGKATDCHVLARMIREVEVSGDWFNLYAPLSFLSTSRRCSRKRSPGLLPVFTNVYLFV